jgi:hypothetical protein
MPRTRTGRPSPSSGTNRRRTNGGVTSIRLAPRTRTVSVAPYTRDPRWATPAQPRNDVVVVDIARPVSIGAGSSDDEPLLLTA